MSVVSPPAEQLTGLSLPKGDEAYLTDATASSAAALPPSADTKSNPAKANWAVRKGAVVEMSFDGIPLLDAIASLAAATGGRVHGSEILRSVTGSVKLHWQGMGPDAAWAALLSPVANVAVACGPQSCDVWIVGLSGNVPNSKNAVPDGTRGPNGSEHAMRSPPGTAALPMRAPPLPESRRNDGPLEAPSSD